MDQHMVIRLLIWSPVVTFVRLSYYIRRKIHWFRSQTNAMLRGTKTNQLFLLNRFIEFWKVCENIYLYCSYMKAYRFLPHWAKLKKWLWFQICAYSIPQDKNKEMVDRKVRSGIRDNVPIVEGPTILNLSWFTKWWIKLN